MVKIRVLKEELEFYKTAAISLTSIVILSWFVYALFSENYLGSQFFNNLGYMFIPVLRPDFIIYFAVIPVMTSFWNILFQSRYRIKYVVKSFPVMYMMAPFFLDNFYFLLNHVPLDSFIEIQFIFISNPTVLTYQILTVFYLIAGFITLFYADKIWQVLIAMAFAIAMYSSLFVSSLLEPQILELAIYLTSAVPVYGFLLGNQIRLWYVSFETNGTAYLVTYGLILLIVSLMMLYFRFKLGKDWWNRRPVDVSSSKIVKFIEIIERKEISTSFLHSKKEVKKMSETKTRKKLSKEERRKLREKRRAETTIPTKMNLYLYFVLIFAGIVTFFDGWSTLAITLAMGGFGGGIESSPYFLGLLMYIIQEFSLPHQLLGYLFFHFGIDQQFTNPDLFSYFNLAGSPVTMGIILSVAGFGVVAAISFKYFVDKYGRRPLTLITAIAFITFSVLTAFTPRGGDGLIIFLILRILANYFLSADIVVVIMAEEAPDRLRGRLVGAVLATNAVGGFVCGIIQAIGVQIPMPWGVTLSTWQSLFFLTSIGYIFIIPLYFFLKETKRFKGMKKYEKWRKKRGLKPKTGWLVPLKRKYIRPMTLGCIMGFLGTLVTSAQVTFFALYFAKEQHMSSSLVGIVSLPIMISASLGYYLAGPLIDRWGRVSCIHRFGNLTIWAGAFLAWPSLFVAGDIPNPLLQTIVVLGTMLSAFCAPIWATAATIIPLEMFPTHIRSTATGWTGAIARGGTILAPFLVMYGAEELGGLGLTYHFVFRLIGLVVLTILFTAYLLAPESKGRMLEEIAATEVHASQLEKVPKEKYNEPYYWYLIGLPVFFISFFVYGIGAGGEIINILPMMAFYIIFSAICIIIVAYVRKILTENKK